MSAAARAEDTAFGTRARNRSHYRLRQSARAAAPRPLPWGCAPPAGRAISCAASRLPGTTLCLSPSTSRSSAPVASGRAGD
jgi:hypothetical protein